MNDLNIKCSVCDKPPGYECRWHFVRDVRAAEKERDALRARLEAVTADDAKLRAAFWQRVVSISGNPAHTFYQCRICTGVDPARNPQGYSNVGHRTDCPAWLDAPAPSAETKP